MNKRLRRKLRPLRHQLVYCLAVFGKWLFQLLPLDTAVGLGGLLGRLAAPFCFELRRAARKNLDLAFGLEKTDAEKRAIIRGLFDHLGRSLAETLTAGKWSAEIIRRRIQGDARMAELDAFRNGKGLLIITAHLGCWELFSGYVSLGHGLPLGVVARDLKNPKLEQLLYRNREQQNLEILLRGKTGRAIFRHLQENKVMGILADQDTRRGPGIFAEFFGRPAYTPLGPWQLAARTGCAAIVAFIVRQPDGLTHRVEFAAELTLAAGGDTERSGREFTQAFTRCIEDYVRKYPEQWMWFHRRWRRQPAEKSGESDQPGGKNWTKGDSFVKTDN